MRLSPGTRRRVDHLFAPADRAIAARLLMDECGTTLPNCSNSDKYELERVRYAALKVSQGQLARLTEAVELAKRDCWGLLVQANFTENLAHKSWLAPVSAT